jgi:hypothetical protein
LATLLTRLLAPLLTTLARLLIGLRLLLATLVRIVCLVHALAPLASRIIKTCWRNERSMYEMTQPARSKLRQMT